MKKYSTPVVEITKFENESIITESGGGLAGQGGIVTTLTNANAGINEIDF